MGMGGFGGSWDSPWMEAFPKPQDSMGPRHCWVELSGFGADCKDAVLQISGREMGNTMEKWGLIFFFTIYSSQLLLTELLKDPCCPELGLLIIFMFL